MKTIYAIYIIPIFIIGSILLGGCASDDPVPDNSQNVNENPPSHYVSFSLEQCGSSFKRFDGRSSKDMMLTDFYDNGLPKIQIIVNNGDTLATYYNTNGYPEMITDGHTYVAIGNHKGNEVTVGVYDGYRPSQTFTVTTDTDWSELANSLKATRGNSRNSEDESLEEEKKYALVSAASWKSAEIILETVIDNGFKLKISNPGLFLAEIVAYVSTSDNKLLETEQKAFLTVSGGIALDVVLAGGSTISLALVTAQVWVDYVFKPLYKNGILFGDTDWEFWQKEVNVLYRSVGDVKLTPCSAEMSWAGGSFISEIDINNPNFDINNLSCSIVSPECDWLTATHVRNYEKHSIAVDVKPYDSKWNNQIREHTIRIRLDNVYDDSRIYEIYVRQYPKAYTKPSSLTLSESEKKTVAVVSPFEEWHIKSVPSWLNVEKSGLYGFFVQSKEPGKPMADDIVIEVQSAQPYEILLPVSQEMTWRNTKWNVHTYDFQAHFEGESMDEVPSMDFKLEIGDNPETKFDIPIPSGTYWRNTVKATIDEDGCYVITADATMNHSEDGLTVTGASRVTYKFVRYSATGAEGTMIYEVNVKSAYGKDVSVGSGWIKAKLSAVLIE